MSDRMTRVYEELANHHHYKGEVQVRDRMLLLAADAALAEGREPDAERLRARLLELNPHHLLKPFPNMAQAMRSPDVSSYVEGLRRTYPRAQAEQMWAGLRGAPTPGISVTAVPVVEVPTPVAPQTPVQPPPLPVAPQVAAAIPIAPAVAMPVSAAIPVQPAPPAPPPPAVWNDPGPAESVSARPRRRAAAGWMAPVLFVIVMVSACALALYTLVRPILQL